MFPRSVAVISLYVSQVRGGYSSMFPRSVAVTNFAGSLLSVSSELAVSHQFYTMELEPCYFCGRAGILQCGGCGKVSACSPTHLRLHRRGDESCFPWEVLEKPVVGRCMVTTRYSNLE